MNQIIQIILVEPIRITIKANKIQLLHKIPIRFNYLVFNSTILKYIT